MSWKLAELSWRQALGLNQSRHEKAEKRARIEQEWEFDKIVAGSGREKIQIQSDQCRSRKRGSQVATRLGAPLQHKRPSLSSSAPSVSASASLSDLNSGSSAVPLLLSFQSLLSPSRSVDAASISILTSLPPSLGRASFQRAARCQFFSPGFVHLQSLFNPIKDALTKPQQLRSHPKIVLLVDQRHQIHLHRQFPRLAQGSEAVESPTFEYLRHFLGHEDVVFEILNSPLLPCWSIHTPEDSAHQPQFASPQTKHWSGCPCLPPNMESNDDVREDRANPAAGPNNHDDNDHFDAIGSQTFEEMFTREYEGPRAPPNSLAPSPALGPGPALYEPWTLGHGIGNNEYRNEDDDIEEWLAGGGLMTLEELDRLMSTVDEAFDGGRPHPGPAQQPAGDPPNLPLPALPVHAGGVAARDVNGLLMPPSNRFAWLPEDVEMTPLPAAVPDTEAQTNGISESFVDNPSLPTGTYGGPALSDIDEDATQDEYPPEDEDEYPPEGEDDIDHEDATNGEDITDAYYAADDEYTNGEYTNGEDTNGSEFGGVTDISRNSGFTAEPESADGDLENGDQENGDQDSLQSISSGDTTSVEETETELPTAIDGYLPTPAPAYHTNGNLAAHPDGFHFPVANGYPAPVANGHPAPGFHFPLANGYPVPVTDGYPAPVADGYPAPVADGHPAPVADGHPAPVADGFQGIVSTWDPLSGKGSLSLLPCALLTDKLKTCSLPEKQHTKEADTKFGIQFTNSLQLPSQAWPDSKLGAISKPGQQETTSVKTDSSTSAIIQRNAPKSKVTAAKKTIKMPRSSGMAADSSDTTSTEPFPDLDLSHSEMSSLERTHLMEQAARIYGISSPLEQMNELLTRIAPEPRRRREFPNARLTIDRRHRIMTDPHLVAAQDIVGANLLVISTILYPFGGFLLINSMAKDGSYAHNAMMEMSKIMGLPVVGSVGTKHKTMAKQIQTLMIWVAIGAMVAVVGILAYALVA
ncbi:hypothetical protein DV738_g3913, partial [Chaetothyriales sp. CBS 135597]